MARNPLGLEFVNAEKSCENRSALVMNAGIQLVCWCLDCSSGLQGLQGLLCPPANMPEVCFTGNHPEELKIGFNINIGMDKSPA